MIESEATLFERAAQWADQHSTAGLDRAALRDVALREGIDFATALLYHRVTHSAPHARFIHRVSQTPIRTQDRKLKPAPTVAIVPAAFYKEKPHSGADGRVVRAAAVDTGFNCELIPLPSTGTLAANSKLLIEWLVQRAGDQFILVSLCKGGADVKVALARSGAADAFRNVPVWINICGTLNGSPIAQWLLSKKLTLMAAWIVFKCQRRDFEFLRELAPLHGGPLSAQLELPDSMQLITVAGFPLRRHLSNGFMRRCHRVIAPMGPTDGGMLLADAAALPGLLYPIWGADHYLRPEVRARKLLATVLEYVRENCLTAPACTRLHALS
jgi:hypothetical protein